MPRFDGTGPTGKGPMSGRGMGNCRGAGQGRGCRRFCPFFAENSEEFETEETVKDEIKNLKEEVERLKQKINNG